MPSENCFWVNPQAVDLLQKFPAEMHASVKSLFRFMDWIFQLWKCLQQVSHLCTYPLNLPFKCITRRGDTPGDAVAARRVDVRLRQESLKHTCQPFSPNPGDLSPTP